MKRFLFVACTMLVLGNPSASPARDGEHWYRGNTHTHTINSDGDSAPDVVVRWYREHGYQFVFITDHEYVTDVAALNVLLGADDRFLVLPGQEVTQWGEDPKRSAAHVNSLFATGVIWPVGVRKCTGSGCGAHAPASMSLAETLSINISAIRRQGAIPQVNHPNYRWSTKTSDMEDVPDGTLLEIWNGQDRINNLGGDDGSGDVRPSAEGYWDYLLSRGKTVWGVGADDSHRFKEGAGGSLPGQAWIMVRATELTPAAIRTALQQGQFYASNGVTLSEINSDTSSLSLVIAEAQTGTGRYTTRFIGSGGVVLAEIAGTRPSYRFKGDETYVRAAVIDSNGKRAWTQPVFFKLKPAAP
jgi:hypothetical protein